MTPPYTPEVELNIQRWCVEMAALITAAANKADIPASVLEDAFIAALGTLGTTPLGEINIDAMLKACVAIVKKIRR